MKSLILVMTTIFSVAAQAEFFLPQVAIQKYVGFAGVSQKINPKHAAKPGQISLEINYETETVQLHIARDFYCPKGLACPMVMAAPLVAELPILSVKSKACGIRQIIAGRDDRPVDGIREEIKVDDISATTCAFFREVESEVIYTTQHYNHLTGKEELAISKMNLHYAGPAVSEAKAYKLTGGEIEPSGLEVPTAGTLKFNDKKVVMNVQVGLDCSPSQVCPDYTPAPIQASLDIVSIEKSDCGDKVVAQGSIGTKAQTVELVDYSNALCKIVINNRITVDYTETISGINPRQPYVRKAKLLFN